MWSAVCGRKPGGGSKALDRIGDHSALDRDGLAPAARVIELLRLDRPPARAPFGGRHLRAPGPGEGGLQEAVRQPDGDREGARANGQPGYELVKQQFKV